MHGEGDHEEIGMEKHLSQGQRLDFLIDAFKADSENHKDLLVPEDTEGKQRLLRSLMNIRLPREIPREVLRIQDAYLRERAKEKGIVAASEIPTVREAYGSGIVFSEKLSLWQGDITRLAVDAIVNAANSRMLGCFIPMHTCIDNCIHSFAGVQLRAECERRMVRLRKKFGQGYEQQTAVPMLTDGYNLPAGKIIHIVGPIMKRRLTGEMEQDLELCYRNTLDMCLANGLGTVAFCCISTGVFRFPNKRASEIAVQSVLDWMTEHPTAMKRVIFNVFKEEDKACYERLFQ